MNYEQAMKLAKDGVCPSEEELVAHVRGRYRTAMDVVARARGNPAAAAAAAIDALAALIVSRGLLPETAVYEALAEGLEAEAARTAAPERAGGST